MPRTKELKSLSEFEWASVARYMIYISAMANLEEVASSDVLSFGLAKFGADRLIARKTKVLALLEHNMLALTRFAKEYQGDLSDDEKAVIRSAYRQYHQWANTVENHLVTVRSLVRIEEAKILLGPKEEHNDEVPF